VLRPRKHDGSDETEAKIEGAQQRIAVNAQAATVESSLKAQKAATVGLKREVGSRPTATQSRRSDQRSRPAVSMAIPKRANNSS
jgi:hypothetical protein